MAGIDRVQIHGKWFDPMISAEEIRERVEAMGKLISEDYPDSVPLLIGVLNGAFVFMADLIRAMEIPVELHFIKMRSYVGMQSGGAPRELIGVDFNIKGRDVIVVEDIVDTGITLSKFIPQLYEKAPNSVRIATLLLKEEIFDDKFAIDWVGFRIPNAFVVGYGLDYNDRGRELEGIFKSLD